MAEPSPYADVSLNNSSRKIRLNTPTANPTEEAMNLLHSWNLAHLCAKFRDQEVCTVAFQHITDADINELIPKIGPRAIFRARLAEWRQEIQKQEKQHPSTPVSSCLPPLSNGQDNRKRRYQPDATTCVSHASKKKSSTINTSAEPTVIKMETMDSDEQQWLREVEELQDAVAAHATDATDAHEDESLLETLPPSTATNSPSPHPVDDSEENLLNDSDFLPDENNVNTNTSATSGDNSNFFNSPTMPPNSHSAICYSQQNHERVNVKDILKQSYDGRQAIERFTAFKCLDVNDRKRIVKCLISAVIERRVIMTVNCFHDLAQQLIDLFPTEKYDNYYVPRMGLTCPRGALYNKYLNMCRRLRRDGLLEYRVQKRAFPNKPT